MKKTDENIKLTQEMINWKSFLDDFYQPIIISDKAGNHLYVNKAACHLTGYSRDELLKLGMQGLADPERLRELAQKLQKRLNDDPMPFSYDFEIILKDRSRLDVKVNGHRIMWGNKPADLVALYNISSKKQDENWFQVKTKLSENLNKIFSTDLCFKVVCRFIAEEGLYEQSILLRYNKSSVIFNIGYNGVNDEFIQNIRKNKPFTETQIAMLCSDKYKIGDSFFIPDGTINKIIPHFKEFPERIKTSSDLTRWQQGDVLIVPLLSETNSWIGHLTVGAPYNGKRPDLRTVRKLEEVLYLVSKRLIEIKHQDMIYESEQRYRAIAEQSILPFGIWYKERYIYVNQAFCDLAGYSKKEILNWEKDDNRKLIHPDEVKKIFAFDKLIHKDHSKQHKIVVRGTNRSGGIRWLEIYWKKINFYGLSSELLTFVDRTNEIVSEKKLQVNEEQARTLLDAMNDAVLLINKEGLILNLNKHYAGLIGKKQHEVVGNYIWDVLEPEHVQSRKELIQEVVLSGKSFQINERKGDKFLKTGIYPILNQNKEVERIAIYVQDITEEQEMTRKLFQAEKLAAIGNLTSGIVHQIRNPLGNISFAAQLGLQQKDLNNSVKEYLELILNDVENANDVIQKLTEYNNPHAIELQKGNILEPIYKAISYTKSRRESQNIKLTFDHPAKLPKLMISEYWLEQIFVNIINNSMQAIKSKGEININVNITKEQSKLSISFTDNGSGIPENKLSQVSDPFFTTKEKGVGLGLSIVNKIVELHNGIVKIESQEQKYTTLTITFSLKESSSKYYKMMSFPF